MKFVGSGIFKSANPEKRARATVLATKYYNDAKTLAGISEDLDGAILGINAQELEIKLKN